ncbi:hypothetical protein CP083_06955 [Candidatus Bathyarchaeota archaeon B24-2]|nr:MAG: hypothetical protein CP083_06955 [Candidatus Bathyarchaeota archaeon B24-2]
MNRRLTAFIAVLAVSILTLAVCASKVEAQPIQEIAYDDGTAEFGVATELGSQLAVRFSLPSGWSEAQLLTAKYYIRAYPSTFRVHVYGSDGSTELITPFEVTPTTTGWLEVDLSALNIIVTDDFYITIEYITTADEEWIEEIPFIGGDSSNPDGRSYMGTAGSWNLHTTADLMIRAVVQQRLPVGGTVLQTNSFTLLTPYIAIFAAIAIGLTVALKKRL